MAWRIGVFPASANIEARGQQLIVNGVEFTDARGWSIVPISYELRAAYREGDLAVRLGVRHEDGARAMYAYEVRVREVVFASLASFSMRRGSGWTRYIPMMMRKKLEAHVGVFAPASQRSAPTSTLDGYEAADLVRSAS